MLTYILQFLIQADFILEAGRQDVVDSPRNKAILKGVAHALRDAIVAFSASNSPLRYQWVRYFSRYHELDQFWKAVPERTIQLLRNDPILYPEACTTARFPNRLRTLCTHFPSQLDSQGKPLFADLPRERTYLSLDYGCDDTRALKRMFGLQDVDDEDIYNRLSYDLEQPGSKMKSSDTDQEWHSRAATLISAMFERSAEIQRRVSTLALIPGTDGNWKSASSPDLHFPSPDGPPIPGDIMITVSSQGVENPARKRLFSQLGVTDCSPRLIIDRLSMRYSSHGGGASSLFFSKAHLSYLFWNHEYIPQTLFPFLWVYDSDGVKVTPASSVVYLPSADEYGAQQLLKEANHPRDPTRLVPRCRVSFIDQAYLDLFPLRTRYGDYTWLEWLMRVLGVRSVPRLKTDRGSLSGEFRHIIAYQPSKLLETLKKYWHEYSTQIGSDDPVLGTIRQAEVPSETAGNQVIQQAYAPLPSLKALVQSLGVDRGFPFLQLGPNLTETQIRRDWRFLEEFGVRFEPQLNFFIEVLRQHKNRRQRAWDETARSSIIRTYEAITEHYAENDKAWLRYSFSPFILHPIEC
jgi:hypothetical protein